MKRTFVSTMVATLAALSTLGLSLSASAAADYSKEIHYTFDQTIKPFVAGGVDPENVSVKTLVLQFDNAVNDSVKNGQGAYKNGYARLMSQFPSPVWMQAKYVIPNGLFRVNVNFMARAEVSCGGCVTIVRVGNQAPISLDGFQSDYAGLNKQWDAHTYSINLAGKNGKGEAARYQGAVISIGFANLDQKGLDMNNVEQAIQIDNVGIEFEQLK